MSLIKLKSKTKPKYISKLSEPRQTDSLSELSDSKVKTPLNSASSLQMIKI